MIFAQKPLPFIPKLSTRNIPEGRVYETPEGDMLSVTTILKAYQKKEYLIKWRAKIGNEAADAIVNQARTRGDAVHKMAELYLKNETEWFKDQMTVDKTTFMDLKPFLDNHVELVYGAEIPLYSPRLRVAGTADACVVWQGKNAVVDFKTSLKPVGDNSDKLRFYKMQTAIYAILIKERYNIDCEWSHILIAIDNRHPKLCSFRNVAFRDIAENLIEKVMVDKFPIL